MNMEGPPVDQVVPVDEIDMSQCPTGPVWIPRWLVDCGKGCEVGITIDDHCFVVLVKDWHGNWRPARHIPREVAERLAELSYFLLE